MTILEWGSAGVACVASFWAGWLIRGLRSRRPRGRLTIDDMRNMKARAMRRKAGHVR